MRPLLPKEPIMNNTQKTVTVLAVAAVAVASYTKLSKNTTLDHLNERFDNLDQKAAKRAYRQIMKEALTGKVDFSNWSTEQFDDLFFIKYNMIKANLYQ
jgi:hypothetical protein